MSDVETTPQHVERVAATLKASLKIVRKRLARPLTLAEKVLYGHLDDPRGQDLEPGRSYLRLRVDRVIMQDATAQMVILQFMQAGRKQVAVPSSVHCAHLIQAYEGAGPDTERARVSSQDVYAFLRSACAKYGVGFWGPGSGIIHQVVLENYAFPGGLSIGSDSDTPNMGAEIGATTSIFPYDEHADAYLRATDRAAIAAAAARGRHLDTADPEIEDDPAPFFDEVLEIDLDDLEPHIVGPFTPDLARPVSQLAEDAAQNNYPVPIAVALIGSCTNSSDEDVTRAATVAAQARATSARASSPAWSPPAPTASRSSSRSSR